MATGEERFLEFLEAHLFMSVFGLGVDTSLQCFIAAEEMGIAEARDEGRGRGRAKARILKWVARLVFRRTPRNGKGFPLVSL